VCKLDGRREPFDREKLMRGLMRAAAKRPLAMDQLEQVVERVEAELGAAGGELPSERIGEIVLRELRGLDAVAYVRFASVYRRFEDAEQFAAELGRLEGDSVRLATDDAELPPESPRVAAKPTERAAKGEEQADGA
jgi:transcriptional repressor NrdR